MDMCMLQIFIIIIIIISIIKFCSLQYFTK